MRSCRLMRSLLSVLLILLPMCSATGRAGAAEIYCGRLSGNRIYLDHGYDKLSGDASLWYTITYKQPRGQIRSSRIKMILDTREGRYFDVNGFDCTEPEGRGSCSHFEFIPSGEFFERHMADRTSWDKISENNLGGLILRCLTTQQK